MSLPIKIRQGRASDVRKIVRTWQRTHSMFGCAVMPMYARARGVYMAKHMESILGLTDIERVKVCCSIDDEDLIYGWVCYEPTMGENGWPVLHYVYTTDGFRHYGVATGLLRDSGCLGPERIWVSHFNYRIKRLFKKLRQKWYYDPYLLEGANDEM